MSRSEHRAIILGNPESAENALKRVDLGMTGMGIVAQRVGREINAAFQDTVSAASKFGHEITTAAAVTATSADQMDGLRTSLTALAQELGSRSVFSSQQAAEALTELGRRGINPVAIGIEGLMPLLEGAVAANADLATVSEIVASALQVYGEGFDQSAKYVDIFVKSANISAASVEDYQQIIQHAGTVSAQAGIKIEELAGAYSLLANKGVSASVSATGLKAIVQGLQNPISAMRKIMEETGITMDDMNLKTHSLQEVIAILLSKGFDVATDSMEVFGKRGGPVFAAMASGAKDASGAFLDGSHALGAYSDSMKDSVGSGKVVSDFMKTSFQSSVTALTNSFLGLKQQIGSLVTESIQPYINYITEQILPNTKAWVSDNEGLTRTLTLVAGSLGGVLVAIGSIAIPLGLLGLSFKGVSPIITTVVGALGGLSVASIATVLLGIGMLTTAWYGVVDAFSKDSSIKKFVEEYYPAIDYALKSLGTYFGQLSVDIVKSTAEQEASYMTLSETYKEESEAIQKAVEARAAGEQEAADMMIAVAKNLQADRVQRRITEITEEKAHLDAILENKRKYNGFITDEERAHQEQLAQNLNAHWKALRVIEEEGLVTSRKSIKESNDEKLKIIQEGLDAFTKSISDEARAVKESADNTEEYLEDKLTKWKEFADDQKITFDRYVFDMDQMTQEEIIRLKELLENDDIKLSEIHGVWQSWVDRIASEQERMAKEQERHLEAQQKAFDKYAKEQRKQWDNYLKELYGFVNDVVEGYVEWKKDTDEAFAQQYEIYEEYQKRLKEYWVAVAIGWEDMADDALRELGRLERGVDEGLGAVEKRLEQHAKGTYTFSENTREYYKLLQYAINTELNGVSNVWIPFTFENIELQEAWAKATKETKDKIISYIREMASATSVGFGEVESIFADAVGNSWWTDGMDKMAYVTNNAATSVSRAISQMSNVVENRMMATRRSIQQWPKLPTQQMNQGHSDASYGMASGRGGGLSGGMGYGNLGNPADWLPDRPSRPPKPKPIGKRPPVPVFYVPWGGGKSDKGAGRVDKVPKPPVDPNNPSGYDWDHPADAPPPMDGSEHYPIGRPPGNQAGYPNPIPPGSWGDPPNPRSPVRYPIGRPPGNQAGYPNPLPPGVKPGRQPIDGPSPIIIPDPIEIDPPVEVIDRVTDTIRAINDMRIETNDNLKQIYSKLSRMSDMNDLFIDRSEEMNQLTSQYFASDSEIQFREVRLLERLVGAVFESGSQVSSSVSKATATNNVKGTLR